MNTTLNTTRAGVTLTAAEAVSAREFATLAIAETATITFQGSDRIGEIPDEVNIGGLPHLAALVAARESLNVYPGSNDHDQPLTPAMVDALRHAATYLIDRAGAHTHPDDRVDEFAREADLARRTMAAIDAAAEAGDGEESDTGGAHGDH